MKKEVKRVKMSPEIMDRLQRAHYDVQTRQMVVTTLFENHAMDDDASVLTSVAFKTYHHELEEAYVRLDLLKNAITAGFIPEEFKEKTGSRWEADFAAGELVIYA